MIAWFTRQNPKHLFYASLGLNAFLFSIVLACGLRAPCPTIDLSGYELENKRMVRERDSLAKEFNILVKKDIEQTAKVEQAIKDYQTIKAKYEKIKYSTPKRPDYSGIADTSLMGKWANHTR